MEEKTSNQYFISTHSAHLIDAATDAAVFHFLYDRQTRGTIVRKVQTDTEKVSLCADLGYKASDLVQTNAIVWVEGPSDRIYINHWIKAIDEGLVEGLHYSIMFYGGRLLSHLTADDPEVEEFISLRRLNQNLSVLIDSDKEKPQSRLNKTKARVASEFQDRNGLAWVTKGREIENYVSLAIMKKVISRLYPGSTLVDNDPPYGNALNIKRKGMSVSVDKIKVARAVASHPADLDVLDLKERIEELVDFIKDSNPE